MAAKTILYQENARKALEKGMDTIAEAVSITLGPKGRNVVLEKKYGIPQIVNDGVTIAKEINLKLEKEKIDITLPERDIEIGKIHPVSQVIDELTSIFSEIGFSVAEGPDIENEYNNFTALNTPEHHPARDMQDTFYLDENRLLRTHTSPVQIRYLENNPPPVRIIAPGRVYRRDAVDATHSPVFNQVEVLCIDQHINLRH